MCFSKKIKNINLSPIITSEYFPRKSLKNKFIEINKHKKNNNSIEKIRKNK